MPSSFVRVLGVALAVSACEKSPEVVVGDPPPPPINHNPPPPEPTADPVSSDLPTWDAVASGHPEGATNPPRPVLIVTREPLACYKGWVGGMVPPTPDIRAAGGVVVATAADVPHQGTQVQCPEGQPQKLLDAWAAWEAGQSSEQGPR